MAEDKEGSLWIGTRNGLSQLADVKFPTLAERDGLGAPFVQSVSRSPRGGLWAATSKGAIYFNGKAAVFSTESGLGSPYVKRVFEASNGDVFLVGGRNEIEVLSAGRVLARHTTKAMPVAFAEDARGVIVSVGGELYRVGRDHLEAYPFANGPPLLYWILNLTTTRDGSLWVASVNGVCRIRDGRFQQWTAQNGLGANVARWVCEDSDGVIWVGLESGLARLKDNHVRNIRQDDGLFDGNIYAIVPDAFGSLWIDSTRGLYRVNRRNLGDFADGNADRVDCVTYDDPEAVKQADKLNQEHSGCQTAEGRIWFPSQGGVVMIDPAAIPTNQLAPPVHVHQVRANGAGLALTNGLAVRPGNGDLEFYYTALSFIAPQKLRFRYRLEGYDRDWVDAGNRRVAFYTGLRSGRYRFRVIACNADGVWNTEGDSFDVRLLPHFYETLWFYLGCGLSAVGLLAGLYLCRVSHLQKKQRALQKAQEHLEALVKERTADLSEANASLKGEIEQRQRMELEIQRAQRELLDISRQAGMAEVATSVLHNVGNVLNSVNVSASLVSEKVRKSKITSLTKVAALLEEQAPQLASFLSGDPRGAQLPAYLSGLARHLVDEQTEVCRELDLLTGNIEHIKEIVAMQQNYSRISGVAETLSPVELIEDALRMHGAALARHQVQVVRDYAPVPPVCVERHNVLQILVNLIQNSKYALDQTRRPDKVLTLSLAGDGNGRFRISVQDNGVGIAPENLMRIFAHGFTTRKDGHGFGLHSSALVAKEMDGSLSVHSDGPGQGARFTLDLPCRQKETHS